MKKRMERRYMRSVLIVVAMIASLFAGVPNSEDSKVQAAQTLSNPGKRGGVVTWDCVYFGRYPQSDATGSRTDAIKWRVLSVSGQDAFLVADCNLDVYHYYDTFEDITWAKSLVRSWLNGYGYSSNPRSEDFRKKGFIDKAFTEMERESIRTTTVVTSNNPEAGNSVGGDNTNDKIFLLSYEEVTNSAYGFASAASEDPARIRTNTAYVGAGGIEKSSHTNPAGQSGCWWLRSPGSFNRNAMYVGEAGYTYVEGYGVETGYFAICPALHLNLSNSNIWSYAGTVSSDGSSTAGEEPPSEQQRTQASSQEQTTAQQTTTERTTGQGTTGSATERTTEQGTTGSATERTTDQGTTGSATERTTDQETAGSATERTMDQKTTDPVTERTTETEMLGSTTSISTQQTDGDGQTGDPTGQDSKREEQTQNALPAVGSTQKVGKGGYKVTASSQSTRTVTFVKPTSSKQVSARVPATITLAGATYQVTAVAPKAFKKNTKLKSVTIGKNVGKIGKEAFYGCTKLKRISIQSTGLKTVGRNAIGKIHKEAVIKVPKKQYNRYRKLFKRKTGFQKTMKIKK